MYLERAKGMIINQSLPFLRTMVRRQAGIVHNEYIVSHVIYRTVLHGR